MPAENPAGRSGYQEIVARSLGNAKLFARWVMTQPNLELMAPANLNIVCFRANNSHRPDSTNDAQNAKVIESIQRGGIACVTATRWRDRAAMRAAFDNWATTNEDILGPQQAVADAAAAAVADAAESNTA